MSEIAKRAFQIADIRGRALHGSGFGGFGDATADRTTLLGIVDDLHMEAGAVRELLLRARYAMPPHHQALTAEIDAVLASVGHLPLSHA